jgi:hypothetical protein
MNNLAGISVVTVKHRDTLFERCTRCLKRLHPAEIIAVAGAPSLFAAYDHGWRRATSDTVCFMHEDVELEGVDESLIHDRLRDETTGFVGVAGSRVLDKEATWWKWIRSPHKERMLSGRCGHRSGSDLWVSYYGPFGEVAVLDGVLLITTKAVLEAIGGFADPPLDGFDFYDISATFRARLAGLKNYTIPANLFHRGMGHPRQGWVRNRQAFLDRYGTHLPYAVDPALIPHDDQ